MTTESAAGPTLARLEDAALDAALLALAFGAALNLSTGQIAIGCTALALGFRSVRRRDGMLSERARELGPALTAPVVFLLVCALSSVVTPVAWPGWFESTRWRPLVAVPV